MPIRGEISISEEMPISSFGRMLSHQPLLSARILVGAIALTVSVVACAQDKPAPPTPAPQPSTSASADKSTANQTPNAPSNIPGVALYNLLQRRSIVFPDIAASTEPLSPGKKFQLFVDNSISVHTGTWAILGSLIGQAENSPTGFGQGWDAYGSRFGSSMARQASSEFFGTFVLASALHEDPRFYPEIRPSFFHAVKYSVQRVFITRKDDGRDVTNWHGLVAPAMAEGLANVYWPDRNRTAGDTLYRYGLDLATRAGGNMLREYWPVFYSKMHHAPH